MYTTTIEIARGNTYSRPVTMTQGGVAFNMTGYTLRFVAKEEFSDPDTGIKISKTATFASPPTGVGILSLAHADTDIKPADYVYEFKLYTAGGAFIETVGRGILRIGDVALLEV